MDIHPLIIIVSAFTLFGLIGLAVRVIIRRDRATIAEDMDEQHEVEAYKKRWGNRG